MPRFSLSFRSGEKGERPGVKKGSKVPGVGSEWRTLQRDARASGEKFWPSNERHQVLAG